uniref:Ground-like domain-containing protein n=1 Tax=Parastrongyloides trichosuri TaxID=131310 RepID=A0A0N4Z916_PARTI
MKWLPFFIALFSISYAFFVFRQQPISSGSSCGSSCASSCAAPAAPPPMPSCGRKKRGVGEKPTEVSHENVICTDETLKKIISENLSEDVKESIHSIRRGLMANETESKFAVICGQQTFSFKSRSNKLCVVGNKKVACHIFEL